MDLIRLRKCKMFASKKKWTAAGKLKIQGLQMMPTNHLEQREEQIYSVIFWHWHSTLIFGWWWTEPLGLHHYSPIVLLKLDAIQFNGSTTIEVSIDLTNLSIYALLIWFERKIECWIQVLYMFYLFFWWFSCIFWWDTHSWVSQEQKLYWGGMEKVEKREKILLLS